MKTQITFILLFLMIGIMKSQESKDSTRMIKYDFLTGKFLDTPIKPRQGEPIAIKVININNFYYKVSIESKDVAIKDKDLLGEIPEALKTDKTPETTDPKKLNASLKIENEIRKPENSEKLKKNTNQEILSKTSSIEKDIKNNATLISAKQMQLDNLLAKVTVVGKKLNSMETVDDINQQIDSLKSLSPKEKKVLENKVNNRIKLEAETFGYQKEIDEINDKITEYRSVAKNLNEELIKTKNQDKEARSMIMSYLSEIKNKYTELYQSANNIYKINDNYNNYIDKVCSPELTLKEYKKISNGEGLENPVILKKSRLEEGHGEINKFDEIKVNLLLKLNDTKLYKIKEELSQLSDGEALITGLNDDISMIKKDMADLSKTVSDLNIRKKLNYVEYLDRILLDEKTYAYTSPTIQGYEDYLKFDITITSKLKLEEGRPIIDRSQKFEYKEYIRGGVRFDFSIGTVFDIGNKQQEFDVVQTNEAYEIIQKTNNQYIPTIAGMLHASWRSANNVAFGFTLGVSMDMTKLQLNSLFPGISVLIGKTDKIIFTAGPALRKVTQLTNGFKVNVPLEISPVGYTSESYKLGWFVGVSWNLTNKQRSFMRLSY